jgi:hypothetical protein
MTHLTIKDLSRANELDAADMAAVSGGSGYCAPVFPCYDVPAMPSCYEPSSSFSLNASQVLGQSQNVMNNNGNNVAFASGISSTVNPTQTGSNNITL